MSASFLTKRDLQAAFAVAGEQLGCDNPSELRDVLVILENKGAVRVELTWQTITIHMPENVGAPIEIARPAVFMHRTAKAGED